MWRNRYEIAADGQPLATWDGRAWRSGGTFALEGQRYAVKANVWGTRFELTDGAGQVVAGADRVGRRRWTVEAAGRVYRFAKPSWWRSDEVLVADGRPVGSVRRLRGWHGGAVADLPGLPPPVQVFVVVVVVTMWNAQVAASSGG